MSCGDDDGVGTQVLALPRPKRPNAVACTCHDAVAITVDVAGHLATLHLCQWCGDSWDLDGTPVSREGVHELVPKSESLLAIWRRSAAHARFVDQHCSPGSPRAQKHLARPRAGRAPKGRHQTNERWR